MEKISCKICGEVFSAITKSAVKSKLGRHINKTHNITVPEYLLEGKDWPLCGCGCAEKVIYSKWGFNKYVKDHKNKVPQTNEVKRRIIHGIKESIYKRVEQGKIDVKMLEDLWKLYVNDKTSNNKTLSDKSGYDPRTIKSYWYKLGIANKEEIKRQSKIHQSVYANQGAKNGQYCAIPDLLLEEIFTVLTNRIKTYTLTELRNSFGISYSNSILFKRLTEKYGKDIIKSLLKIPSSNISIEESTFGNVLTFYFGDNNVIPQYKIKFSENGKKGHRFYDFCLFNKILIEYDGEFWHSSDESKKNDNFKNKLAKSNGFIIFRVHSTEAKNIEILQQIKELIDEVQTSPNQINKKKELSRNSS